MGGLAVSKRLLLALLTALAAALTIFCIGISPAYAAGGWRDTPDATWSTNGTVFDTQLSSDGKTLYIGGKFTTVREKPPGEAGATLSVNNVAAIDVATGTVVRSWRPSVTGTNAVVRELAFANNKVYIGGNFTSVGGSARTHLAAVNATTGATDINFSPTIEKTDGTAPMIFALIADNSKLYVGGSFNKINGNTRPQLAALNLQSGAVDSVWKPKATQNVYDLEFSSDGATIFVAGRFNNITGSDGVTEPRDVVARLYTNTGNVHPWAIPAGSFGDPQTGHDILATPTRLYGGFGDKGPNFVSAYRLDNGNVGDRVWQFDTVGDVQALALTSDGSRLFFGGHFGINQLRQSVCGKPLQGIASLNPANGSIYCDWIPQLQPEYSNGNGPWDMTTIGNSQLWLGGGFTHVTGVNQPNLARFSYDPTLKYRNYAPDVDLNGLQRGGLKATYFDNIDFTGSQITRTDQTVDFDFGNGSPDPAIDVDTFSGRWTGRIEAPVSGQYTFTTTSDDGVRLTVEGEPVIDNWTDHAPTNDSGTITLEAGKRYDVNLEFYENGGGAVIKLLWAPPGQSQTIVPSSNLFNYGNVNNTATFSGGPTSVADPSNLAVTDADDLNMRSARVTLTNRPNGTAETLSANTTGTGIVSSYDAQTGVLSLNGSAPKADYEKVLRTVSYNNTAQSPSSANREVTFVVNDGYVNSAVATSTVSFQGASATSNDSGSKDTQKPVIKRTSPGAKVKSANSTTIGAVVRDNATSLDKADIKFSVDGKQIKNFGYDQATGKLTFSKKLSVGKHKVRVSASDEAGNTATRAWSFVVKRK